MNTHETARPESFAGRDNPPLSRRDVSHINCLAELVAEQIADPGCEGLTLDPLTLQGLPDYHGIARDSVYVVSVFGHERVFDGRPTESEIRSWLVDAYGSLCVGGHYAGFWLHEGRGYLDVSPRDLRARACVGVR